MSDETEENPPRGKERRRASDIQMLEALGRVEDQLAGLRIAVEDRPTKSEVTGMRRLAVFGVVMLILFVVQVTDLHTEACGPGHRSEAVVELIKDAIEQGEQIEPGEIAETIDSATPGWVCGLTFPTHAHDGHDWPESQHVAGIAIYIALMAALAVWVRLGFNPERNRSTKE